MFAFQSLLFVPGARPDRFEKALASDADMVCVDLEDAVPPDAKDAARAAMLAALGDARLAVRINGVATAPGLRDLLALAEVAARPALLLVPMVESARDLAIVRAIVGDVPLMPLVETAAGLGSAGEIAAAPGVVAMMLGGADLAADLGVALTWEPLLTARGLFVMACAAARVPAIDVPFIDLADEAGLTEEATRSRALGFAGKAAIHPAQLSAIAAAFRPSAAALAEAQEALAAFEAAGGAAVRYRDKLLEAPLVAQYRRIIAAGGRHA